ncbi:MAG: hypothetical protein ABIJ50_15330 [Pseudomonadota bacterium]
MKKNILVCIIFLFAISNLYTAESCFARKDITQQLEYIGNPYSAIPKFKKNIYARNIWDMIAFQGKVYLGAGNSSNTGPSPNAGPVPVISYNPETNSFETVFTTSEEQIDVFYIFDNKLYIPGHDPRESWELGNLYSSDDGRQWQKKRTIPKAIHTYCLYYFKGKLFAGVGTKKGAGIAVSEDFGDSWKELSLFAPAGRFYQFLVADNRLYAIGALFPPAFLQSYKSKDNHPLTQVVEYQENGQFTTRDDLTSKQLFPDTTLDQNPLKFYKIIRSQNIKHKSIYIGAYLHNDHQAIPFGLYLTDSLKKNATSVRRITLPDNAVPWDTYKSENFVYVLTNRPKGQKMEVSVLRSSDLEHWEELFYFESPLVVRSFALLQGDFYFSLGSEIKDLRRWKADELKEQTGDLLKLSFPPMP